MGERKFKMSKHMGIFTKKTKIGNRYQVKWRRIDGSQTSKNFRTLREAVDFKRQVEIDKSRGLLPDDRQSKVKFEDYANSYYSRTEHRPSTIRRRKGIMDKHLIPAFGATPISKIRRSDIQAAVGSWKSQGLAARTIINHLNILRPIFAEAVLDDIIVRNPMLNIKAPTPPQVWRNPLTPEQCHALLGAIDPDYNYAIHFALATGVRWSEFANMKIRDFKPMSKMVSVTDSKTEAGVRELPLDEEDILIIAQHIADTGRNGADADSPLFTSPKGLPLNHSNFRQRVFAPACSKAGLKGITFHDLRRTHATMLVAEGHDVKVVQERMGHSSISTTLKYYARATESGKKKAAGVKNRYLHSNLQSKMKQA
jgi:integrase